jgi:hypoxanthine phosphoribosyltransferase
MKRNYKRLSTRELLQIEQDLSANLDFQASQKISQYPPMSYIHLPDGKLAHLFIDNKQITASINEFVNNLERELITNSINKLFIIGVLTGAIYFTIDVASAFSKIPIVLDFIQVSSYGNSFTSGNIKFIKDINHDIKDQVVLLLDDIVSTGKTLYFVTEYLQNKGAKQIITATLLANVTKDNVYKPDFSLFTIDNEKIWIIGYGLDYMGMYRNLKDLYAIQIE